MQKQDSRKQPAKTIESHYRPVGMRAVLAAALMLKAGKKNRLATAKA